MTHFAVVAPPYLGHINPMAVLAAELVGRGHRATFVQIADCEPLLAARGLAFRAVGQRTHPAGHLAHMLRRMRSPNGPFGLAGILRDVADMTDMLCRDLPGALREIGADCLICDGTEAAGGLVAEHLEIPFVTVANALPLNREPGVPPPFVGWRYDASRWGLERNAGGYRVSDVLMRRHGATIAGWAEAWKLAPRRRVDECLSPLAQLAQLTPGLDFPRAELPDSFHYVGRLRGPAAGFFERPARDGRPLGYASLGTLQGGRVALFRRIAAAAERSGVQLVLAHGGGMTDAQAASLPGRPAAFAFVPQNEVLREASVAILNCGLNTVLDALAAGVPIVALPIAFEQGAIAARIERAGAGRVVRQPSLRRARLRAALRSLVHEQTYAAAARRLGAEINGAGGVRLAADIVERVVQTGRPVTRDMAAAFRPAGAGRERAA